MKFLFKEDVVKISRFLEETSLSEPLYIVEVFNEKTEAYTLSEAIKNTQILYEVVLDNFDFR